MKMRCLGSVKIRCNSVYVEFLLSLLCLDVEMSIF